MKKNQWLVRFLIILNLVIVVAIVLIFAASRSWFDRFTQPGNQQETTPTPPPVTHKVEKLQVPGKIKTMNYLPSREQYLTLDQEAEKMRVFNHDLGEQTNFDLVDRDGLPVTGRQIVNVGTTPNFYVATDTGKILEFSSSNLQIKREFNLSGNLQEFVVSPDGRYLFALMGAGSLQVYSLDNLARVGQVNLYGTPATIDLDSDAELIYVGYETGGVDIFSSSHFIRLGALTIGHTVSEVANDSKRDNLYVLDSTQKELIVVDQLTNMIEKRVNLSNPPVQMRQNADELFIMSANASDITVINLNDFTVSEIIRLGAGFSTEKVNAEFLFNHDKSKLIVLNPSQREFILIDR